MGIFDRLSTLIRSNINDLISRAENPEKMLNQLIVDMRGQLAKAKQQVAAAIADEKRLASQVDQEKKNILLARQKRAEAHKRIQETMSSIGDKGVFETFERMAEQIEHEERKLIAAAEVHEDLTGDRLVKQFQALEVKADADQQLLDLKRKLGLLPAGSPAESKQLGKGAAE